MTKERLVLLVILLAAFWLRLWRLPEAPPGLWYDEAYNAMDAYWMAESGHYPVFFVGNNGREPMWHYLLLLFTGLLGRTPFVVRLTGTLAGFMTLPVMYGFARRFLRSCPGQSRWLALAAVGWLAVSWWHLLLSRNGYRPVLLPPALMLSLYFFWRGIDRSAWLDFGLAGLWLGLAQYTYLPVRLAPLIFGGFGLLGTVRLWRRPAEMRRLWGGLVVTGLVSGLVFAPLGLFFLRHPETFSARTGDVAFSPDSWGELAAHLLEGISLLFGAGHELYRHHLPGRAMLGWLEIPFFWLGLVVLWRYRRRPETTWLLLGLGIMWLPSLLASPPVHSLRPVGMLPFYYLVVVLGLAGAVRWGADRLRVRSAYALPVAAALFITLNGLINGYDYFVRWANHPETYKEYNTPLVDLTHRIIEMTRREAVIIPFHLYVHPTARYLLNQEFTEINEAPPSLSSPLDMVLIPDLFQVLYVANIPPSPAMVLLSEGRAYVSRPPRQAEQAALDQQLAAAQADLRPFRDRLGRTVALFAPLPGPDSLEPLFAEPTPLRRIRLDWGGLVQLRGYDITPPVAQPGQQIFINLYWQSQTDRTFDQRLFLQLIDGAGQPLTQWEGDAFAEDMYRWRPAGILPTRHTLWLGPESTPGPYLVRLGFFDRHTGQRLPLRICALSGCRAGMEAVQDQAQLGLFYIAPGQADPRRPARPLAATFGEHIELIGVTLPEAVPQPPHLPVTFHWRAIRPTERPYTVFLQLLNERGEVAAGWDRQPFHKLYPTTLWSPGEIVVDTFRLPLPPEGLPPGAYRLISGFYDFETGQRLLLAGGSDFVELAVFVVE